jgi:hypothetical protein
MSSTMVRAVRLGNTPGSLLAILGRQLEAQDGPRSEQTKRSGHIKTTTCGYQRMSSPVTALPMIIRWISDVPSKIVNLVELRAVSAGRWLARWALVSTNSAPPWEPERAATSA